MIAGLSLAYFSLALFGREKSGHRCGAAGTARNSGLLILQMEKLRLGDEDCKFLKGQPWYLNPSSLTLCDWIVRTEERGNRDS